MSHRAKRLVRDHAPAIGRRPGMPRAAAAKPDLILRREHHQPDWSILIAVVALSAIGILMVYSSSAMRAYVQQDDTLAIVGPQILWGALGVLTMLVVMRLDYRYLRLVSLVAYLAATWPLGSLLVDALERQVRRTKDRLRQRKPRRVSSTRLSRARGDGATGEVPGVVPRRRR